MRYSNDTSQLGVKLTPKLIQAVSQSVISTKRGLLDTEHKLRTGVMRDIINQAGEEIGSHYGVFLNDLLLDPAANDMHPAMRKWLSDTASGHDQWKAISGAIGLAQGLLGTAISNAIAPTVYQLNRAQPNLLPDVQTIAAMTAQGFVPGDQAQTGLRNQGLQSGWVNSVLDAAHTVPTVPDLYDFVNRGLMSAADAKGWYTRNALPTDLIPHYEAARIRLATIADAALGVLRSDITLEQGYELAEANGYTRDTFDLIMLNTGEPPGLEQLLFAYRRGYIDENTLHRGVLQSRIRNEWWPTIYALRYTPLSTADAIQSSVQGYITKEKAKEYATQNGLNPDDFDAAWLAAGDPLSRTEMTYLVNRGFASVDQYKEALRQSRLKDSYIDLAADLIKRPASIGDAVRGYVQGYLTSDQTDKILGENGLDSRDYELVKEIDGIPLSLTEVLRLHRYGKMTLDDVKQALRESRLKDKYIPFALELSVQYPSIYDVRLMLQEGAIDETAATSILAKEGYPADLIKALVKAFSSAGSSTSKTVTEGMLTDLYLESAISRSEFLDLLKADGYSDAHAALIAELADWKIELAARNSLISKVRAEYVGGKITEQQAENDLTVALVPPMQVAKVMSDFKLELAANVTLLSEAQIVDAWNASLFSDGDPAANTSEAVSYLVRRGYSADDADILLQLKNKPLFDGSPSVNAAKSKKNTTGTTSA